jgi:hypothetical protein
MDAWVFRQRVEMERGLGTIRSHVGPWLLPCIWTECDHHALRQNMVAIRDGEKALFYFFCSERHKTLWLHAPKQLGQLPTGSKGMIT